MPPETYRFRVEGMTCGNCARSVERKLAVTPGVSKAAVDLASAQATVEFDSSRVQPEALAEAVRQLGYQVPQ
jgi:copper chaperone CopZ